MALSYTSTELLASIREQGRIPDESPDATDAKLLLMANRQMEQVFVPLVRKARAEWYQAYEDQTIVAGTSEYRIPSRATTSSVRTVLWIDSSGVHRELAPVPLTDRHLYPPTRGVPAVYTIVDDSVALLPTPSSALGTLRIVFERRPGQIVPVSQSAVVATVVSATTPYSYTLTSVGADLVTPIGSLVDFQDPKAPFSLRVMGMTLTGLGNTGTGAGRTIRVGDYFTVAETNVIPCLPPELHSLLALATAAEWLLPIDPQMSSVLSARLAQGLSDLGTLLSPRQQGRQQKLKSTSSRLRRGGRRGRNFLSGWHP